MATIDTWAEFVADFKKQFYLENAKNEAKSRLLNSSNPGLYGSMSKSSPHFMRRDSSNLKDRKVNHKKGRGEKNAQPKVDHERKPPTRKDKNLKTSYKNGVCFICDGPHRARDCSKKASLDRMLAHEDEDTSDGGNIGLMRIFNAIKAKTEVPKVVGKGLQYVEATISDVKVRALVDSNVTHNFVADDEANRLGISATKGHGTIKAVNSKAKPINGVAKDVRAKIG
ncbi:putative retrotransposon gag domain, aspartic peptidase domain protein [Tanacetum coccineum]|uniref:Retrotransposon gag domain, aspartic peptidase domain protein n=1 Tax=Tanacetum coccineum TaxID=301880 RepID=A0ABQ4Z0Z4_9ASTR